MYMNGIKIEITNLEIKSRIFSRAVKIRNQEGKKERRIRSILMAKQSAS